MPITAVTDATQRFGDYAKRNPGERVLPDSKADARDTAGRQAGRSNRKATLKIAKSQIQQTDAGPLEPGKGETVDTKA